MRIKNIILSYLSVFIAVTLFYPGLSFSYPQANESITQYIINLSTEIQRSVTQPERSILYDSKGELRLRLFLSPWGELKDVYVSESSGNVELDSIYLRAVWLYDRYQPFPEELGDTDRWIDVPLILEPTEEIEKAKVREKAEVEPWLFGAGIEDVVDVALENDMGTKIAEEEIALSRLKIREARRALYPAASLNYMETMGKTTTNTQDFTDKEYKLKFEYPLYYGWQLKYAIEQAIANMKASRYNYDKVQQDLRLEVESAFYSCLISKENVRLQENLLREATKIFDTAKKRFDIALSTRVEFLQVESQLKQIKYQLASSKNEMEMARLTLMQAMNVEDIEGLIDMGIDAELFDILRPVDIDIELDGCMELAFRNRPDLRSKEHIVEFNDYERKIALSKDQFKVDLTGSYGRSGGAFESESLNLSKDWYFGIKVSKPLGGNTLSTSYTSDETSEKHGQTSRTESVAKAVEFGILDNLQRFSEKKSSQIALKKAEDELQETRDSIFKEVKESYLSYKKGLIQAATNLNKIRHKEEELKIAKARAELNEMPLSGFLKAHMELTDEKSYYIEAVGSLYQSLAKLNKATGYSLFIDDASFTLADAR